jgi:hypothetical protein
MGGYCDVHAPVWPKVAPNHLKELAVVLKMLDDIEEPDCRDARRNESSILESCANDILNAAALCVMAARGSWFQ